MGNVSLSKYACLGAAITAELMIGFLFGIGVILAVGIVDSLNYIIGHLQAVATNEITTKMASNEVNITYTEEPVQVNMKDPKKVAAGKKLAELNQRKNEEIYESYGIGAVIAVWALDFLDYYIYQRGSPRVNKMTPVRSVETRAK